MQQQLEKSAKRQNRKETAMQSTVDGSVRMLSNTLIKDQASENDSKQTISLTPGGVSVPKIGQSGQNSQMRTM